MSACDGFWTDFTAAWQYQQVTVDFWSELPTTSQIAAARSTSYWFFIQKR